MDIGKIKTLADYIREMDDEAAEAASEQDDAAFIELFSGEVAPTADQIAQYAEDNELDIEEVFQKINTMLHDLLIAKEAEEEEAEGEAPAAFTEEEDPMHEAGETPEEEAEEHMSGEEEPDEDTEPFPFAVGDSVSYETDNPDNLFFGKKLEVVGVEDLGNGDGFVQVIYVDDEGEEISMWFRVGEIVM